MPRADGEPLEFRLRLPIEIELVDLASISPPAGGASARTVKALANYEAAKPVAALRRQALEQVVGPDGIVLVGGLRPSDVPEDDRPVIATLTVAFAEQVKGLPSADQFPIPDPEDAIKTSGGSSTIGDNGIAVTRMAMQPVEKGSLGDGEGKLLLAVWQYLLETSYGTLVMAFATAGMEVLGPRTSDLELKILNNATLEKG